MAYKDMYCNWNLLIQIYKVQQNKHLTDNK